MKTKLLFSMLVSQIVLSQTTITKAVNDPVANDVINNQQIIGTINNTPTGSGVSYNNSTVTGGPVVATNYVAPTATDISTYPGTTIKSTDGANISYFKQSSTKLELLAAVTSAGTINFNVNSAVVMQYPLAFGNTASNQAKGSFTSPTASGLLKGPVAINADASGTLIVGTKTYNNILRVKVTQNFNLYQSTDTTYLFSIGTMTGTTYQYYSSTSKFPVLTYSEGNISVPLLSINQNSSDATAQSFVFLGTKDFQFIEDFTIYPNPAQDFIKIKANDSNWISASIVTMEGRKIQDAKIVDNTIDVSMLNLGTYLLELKGKKENKSIKFIKN
ncbi:MAG: T9SS type A sorting domain-containing protein [Bacteroidetes bacterium]|nr:T9SS type A sorting domain-containing protein [Bacteroidota bacterium]